MKLCYNLCMAYHFYLLLIRSDSVITRRKGLASSSVQTLCILCWNFKKNLVVEILLLPLIKGIKITWQLQIIIFGNAVNAKKLCFLKRIIFLKIGLFYVSADSLLVISDTYLSLVITKFLAIFFYTWPTIY